MSVGWLKELRKEKGYLQKDVYKNLNIPQATYSAIERGYRRPSVDMAKKIADFIGTDWTRFFE